MAKIEASGMKLNPQTHKENAQLLEYWQRKSGVSKRNRGVVLA